MKLRRADNENRDVKETLLLENFLQTIGEAEGKNFFVYLSYSSEAPTDLLISKLLTLGAKVYSPRIEDKQMLAVPYGDDFALSSYGIREPVGQAFLGEMDYIVTPLLAVDLSGNRLGYGGGYYDRYFKKHPKALRVGYCFDFQIVNEVYAEPWDEKIDYIVTDKQIIRANER